MKIIDKDMLWRQFSTTIDSFESALRDCPGGTLKPNSGRTNPISGWRKVFPVLVFMLPHLVLAGSISHRKRRRLHTSATFQFSGDD